MILYPSSTNHVPFSIIHHIAFVEAKMHAFYWQHKVNFCHSRSKLRCLYIILNPTTSKIPSTPPEREILVLNEKETKKRNWEKENHGCIFTHTSLKGRYEFMNCYHKNALSTDDKVWIESISSCYYCCLAQAQTTRLWLQKYYEEETFIFF